LATLKSQIYKKSDDDSQILHRRRKFIGHGNNVLKASMSENPCKCTCQNRNQELNTLTT